MIVVLVVCLQQMDYHEHTADPYKSTRRTVHYSIAFAMRHESDDSKVSDLSELCGLIRLSGIKLCKLRMKCSKSFSGVQVSRIECELYVRECRSEPDPYQTISCARMSCHRRAD